jgi:uncharacterized membrane protein (DUF485 family)
MYFRGVYLCDVISLVFCVIVCRSLLVLLYFFFWPLCCLSFFDLRLLITPLVSTNFSFGHCVVCPSSIHGFWLPLWYLQTFILAIVLSVRLRFTASDYPFGIYKLLLAIVLSVLLRFTASDYPSGIYNLFLGTVNLHNKPSQCQNVNEFDLIFCCWCFQQYFSYIMATSFSGGWTQSTQREPPTIGKQLVNLITYKAGSEPTLYWW